jgi:GxxExxY protein
MGNDDPLTGAVIGAAIEVHRLLGPGLLESVYEECLCRELGMRGIAFRRQTAVPIVYKDEPVNKTFVIDILVEDRLILELKAVDKIDPIHEAQLMTYLKLSGLRLGLLLNFNVLVLKDGIRRRII